jgi:hypothetical protein
MTKWIFILLLLSGCVTQKRCFDKFPPDTITVTHDTTIFKDTTVYIHLQGDTIFDSVAIPVKVPVYLPYTPVEARTSLAYARAWVERRTLKIRLIQLDSIYEFKLDSAIRANKKVVIKTKIVEKPVPPNPFWRNGFFIVGGILILLLVFLVLRK